MLHARGSANTGTQAQEGIESGISTLGRSGGSAPSCAGRVVQPLPATNHRPGCWNPDLQWPSPVPAAEFEAADTPSYWAGDQPGSFSLATAALGTGLPSYWVLVLNTGGYWAAVLAVTGLP